MPPLLSARACWIAGWVSIALGVVLAVATSAVMNVAYSSGGVASAAVSVLGAVNTLTVTLVPLGIALLVGSVVVRHVERLTAALVASGVVEAAVAPPRVARARAADDDADLDGSDVVDHEPGVR